MAERQNRRWGIDRSLTNDMGVIFRTTTALVAALDVTLPTWKRIIDGKGVKEATAVKIVKEFFLLLRGFGDHDHSPDGTYPKYGLDMLDKYREDIAHHRFGKFVVLVGEASTDARVRAKSAQTRA